MDSSVPGGGVILAVGISVIAESSSCSSTAVDAQAASGVVGVSRKTGVGASTALSRINFVLPVRLPGAICTVKISFVCSRSLIRGGNTYGSGSGTHNSAFQ